MGRQMQRKQNTTVEVVRVYKERVGDFTIVSFLTTTGENFIVSSEVVPFAIYLQEGRSGSNHLRQNWRDLPADKSIAN